MRYANDNDPLPFITLRAATLNVIEYLTQKQKTEDPSPDAADPEERVRKPENQTEYVNRRLRDLAAFERRAAGRKDRA